VVQEKGQALQLGLRYFDGLIAMNKISIFNGRKKPFKFEVVVQGKGKKGAGVPNLTIKKVALKKDCVFSLETKNSNIQVSLEKRKLVFYLYRK